MCRFPFCLRHNECHISGGAQFELIGLRRRLIAHSCDRRALAELVFCRLPHDFCYSPGSVRMALPEHPHVPAAAPTAATGLLEQAQAAAARLGRHPQDHGWRELYRLFAAALQERAPAFSTAVTQAAAARPESGDTHLVTVIGIALKSLCPHTLDALTGPAPMAERIDRLEAVAVEHGTAIAALAASRQNSFTGARRFLVPQVLLAAMSAQLPEGVAVRLCDLGTGLGVLPRQLDAPELFDSFAPDLVWPQGIPEYRPIGLAARHAIDRRPLPDIDWVASCYGKSSYYRVIFAELVESLAHPQVRSAPVSFAEVDLLDADALHRYIAGHRINTVTISYALYQLAPPHRRQVLDVLSHSLDSPGIMVVIEPEQALSAQGCSVSVTEAASGRCWRVLHVSDGHFKGQVTPLVDFDAFTRMFPIPIVKR